MRAYKRIFIIILTAAVLLIGGGVLIGVVLSKSDTPKITETEAVTTTTATEKIASLSHLIEDVPVFLQDELQAGCETYAATSLLQYFGYDIDEFQFADDYLLCEPVTFDEVTDEMHGPDLNSAFAGDVYEGGWGIYAPAMAKCIDAFLDDQKSNQHAAVLENITMEELCERYIDKDVPVMIWATIWMVEPDEYTSWQVDYVDENAKYSMGDTFQWPTLEHCMLLCGYDRENYYFADSLEGEIVPYNRAESEKCYQELGMQAIVVE